MRGRYFCLSRFIYRASFDDRNRHALRSSPRLRHRKSKSNLHPRFNLKNRISQYRIKTSTESVAATASAPTTPLSTDLHTHILDTQFHQAESLPKASAHGAHMTPIPQKRGRTLTGVLLPPLAIPVP